MVDFVKKKNPKHLMIVDALNLAFRWKHRGQTEFVDDYINTVTSLARSYECGTVVIAADWGSSSYRKAIYPEYKQNRKDKIAEQTEEEKAAFEEFFKEYEAVLNTIQFSSDIGNSWPVVRFQGVEADDIAAYIVKKQEQLGFEKIWLISSDKDWDLLVNSTVSRFSYVTRKEVTLENWHETHKEGYTPEQYLCIKCLQGDAKDNVPGIPQVGPKRAVELLNNYGSVLDIYDACPLPGKYKYIQNLNDNAEQLITNLELLDLLTYCEDAIGQDNLEELEKIVTGNY